MRNKNTLSKIVQFRLTEREFRKLAELCEDQKLTVSEFMRYYARILLTSDDRSEVTFRGRVMDV